MLHNELLTRAQQSIDRVCDLAGLDPNIFEAAIAVCQNSDDYRNASIHRIDPYMTPGRKEARITYGVGFLQKYSDEATLDDTTAHEIGHYVLGHLPDIDNEDTEPRDPKISRQREKEADEYALMLTGKLEPAVNFFHAETKRHDEKVASLSEVERDKLSHPHPVERIVNLTEAHKLATLGDPREAFISRLSPESASAFALLS